MVSRPWMTGYLSVLIALGSAGCVAPSTGRTTAPSGSVASSSAARAGGRDQGIDEATMKRRLEAIPGVRSVELRTEDGFDTGHHQLASLEVGSSDRAKAIAVVDRALAIMWQGPRDSDKRPSAWMSEAGSGGVVLAGREDVDRRLYGETYEQAMTERYGPWPGRGVPPAW